MSAGRVSDGPLEIAEIDIHLLNEVFRQIELRLDKLTGLAGTIQLYNTLILASSQYATTTNIADVAATEGAGTSTTLPRGDHVHAHGSGYLPNAHHNQVHAIDGTDHTGNLDASAINFTPASVGNWTGGVDPGQTDDALDQLASRTTTLEAGGSTSSGSGDEEQALGILPWEDTLLDETTLEMYDLAGGNAIKLKSLQLLTVGDDLVGELQSVTDGSDNPIYA